MSRLRLIFLLCIVCLFGGAISVGRSWYQQSKLQPAVAFVPDRPITIGNSQSLKTLFDALAYPWPLQPHARVPPVEIATLPQDFPQLVSNRERKALFLRIVLPLVLMRNEQLHRQRETVQGLYQTLHDSRSTEAPSGMVSHSLEILFTEYKIDSDAPLSARLDELLLRLDEVPPSLVLAQAAVESNWGLSTIAMQSNNLFGSWVLLSKNPSFTRLGESVSAYMHFLNMAPAFVEFRKARRIMRIEGRSFESHTLAALVAKRGKKKRSYTRKLRSVIHGSELLGLDDLQLRPIEQATQAD